MSKFDKSMQEIFDIEPKLPDESLPIIASTNTITEVTPTSANDIDLHAAYQLSKDNIEKILEQGQDALEDILAVARESEHPRAFEVAAKMMDSMVNATDRLLHIQKQMRELIGQKNQSSGTNINAVFVGSTTEFLKALREKRE